MKIRGLTDGSRQRLAKIAKDQLPGGLADNMKPSDFDKTQLEKGTKVEMEHTDDKSLAEEISSDHLSEFPNYYKELDKMEEKLKKQKKSANYKETAKGVIKSLRAGDPVILYHVVGDAWENDDLQPFNALMEKGVLKEEDWHWPEDPDRTDADIVCFLTSFEDAVNFQGIYGGRILEVAVPEGSENFGWHINQEGYVAASREIPYSWLSKVALTSGPDWKEIIENNPETFKSDTPQQYEELAPISEDEEGGVTLGSGLPERDY